MQLEQLRERAVISVPEAGSLLGVSRDVAYAMARRGDLPVLRCGQRRVVVPVAAFLQLLGQGESPPESEGLAKADVSLDRTHRQMNGGQ